MSSSGQWAVRTGATSLATVRWTLVTVGDPRHISIWRKGIEFVGEKEVENQRRPVDEGDVAGH
jgi:hypothetical protein